MERQNLQMKNKETRLIFFSCIAERVRDIVGQQLEIRKREQLLGTNMQKVIAKGLCLLETKR